MNSIRKVALACMTAAMVTISVNAGAQGPANQDTFFTFSQAVELPKTTLPAGTYFFQLMDSPSNRHIVKVMSQDRKQLHATLMAIPYYSNDRPSDEPQVRFLETPAANGVAATNAIKIWFYPGNSIGHEFIWPRDKAMQLARATGQSGVDDEDRRTSRRSCRALTAPASKPCGEPEASVQASARRRSPHRSRAREQIGALATPPAEPAPTPERDANRTGAGAAHRPAGDGRRAAAARADRPRLARRQPHGAPRASVAEARRQKAEGGAGDENVSQ